MPGISLKLNLFYFFSVAWLAGRFVFPGVSVKWCVFQWRQVQSIGMKPVSIFTTVLLKVIWTAKAIRTTVVPIRILIRMTVVPITPLIGTTDEPIRILIGTTGI